MIGGVLAVVTAEQLEAQDVAEQARIEAGERTRREAVESSLAAHIRDQFEINKRAKSQVTTILQQCRRQRNGEYDEADLQRIRQEGGSEVYMMLTATRVRAAVSWVTDLVMAGERIFACEPTPEPDIPPMIRQEMMRRLTQELEQSLQAGAQPTQQMFSQRTEQVEVQLREAVREQAERAANAAEQRIEDELVEGGFEEALVEFIDDYATYPAAIMEGPIVRRKVRLDWSGGDAVPVESLVDEYERLSPFDAFPSPGVGSPQDGNFIARKRFSRLDLWNFQGVPGYRDEALRAVLEEFQGRTSKEWTDLGAAARETPAWQADPHPDDGLVDALKYWGSASGETLLEWGMDAQLIPDPLEEYEIEAILIGSHVIYAVLNEDPLQRRPLMHACWQRDPGQFWGKSIPQLMRDIQRMCNGAARALANNMGIASGPQVVVLKDLLPEGEEIEGLYPWKIWQSVSSHRGGEARQPIYFFQPNSNAAELLGVYEQFEVKADDATGVPRYAYGSEKVSGAAQTMGGLSMLLENATKAIKEAVRHIDAGVTVPVVERKYTDLLRCDPDPAIRGDIRIVARGASALVGKAQAQVRRNEFLQAVANIPYAPELIGLKGFAELLKETMRDMDIPVGLMPTDEEIEAMEARMTESQGQQQDPRVAVEQMRLEDKEKDRQLQMQLKQMEIQGDLQELALRKDLSLEQVKARLGELALRIRGDRQKIADEAQIKYRMGSGI